LNKTNRIGTELNGGPLQWKSNEAPQSLTIEQEAAIAFAICGISGPVYPVNFGYQMIVSGLAYSLGYGDLPYEKGDKAEGGSGDIMFTMLGRTSISPDAAHTNAVFVMNDSGTYVLKRPQDFPR
jgi:hypothetical protein